MERQLSFASMKFEERKLISIPRAIGLFMIFEGIFRRDSLDGIEFNDSGFHLLIKIAATASIYLLISSGIILCITRSLLFFYLTYFTCFISLFGIIFEILPGNEVNILWCITLGLAHFTIMSVMIWTHIQIMKIIKEKKKEQVS